MPSKRRKNRSIVIRAEGSSKPLGVTGVCIGCQLIEPLFGVQTNQGYLHLCMQCVNNAITKLINRPEVLKNEKLQKIKAQSDAMTYRVPGSFEAGKRR